MRDVTTLYTRTQSERDAVAREVRRTRDDDDLLALRRDHLLQLALIGDDTLTAAEVRDALRAAYRWGEDRGFRDGLERSFNGRHKVSGPSLGELRRRRGEDPETGEPLPREGDFPGLGVAGAQASLAPQRQRDAAAEQYERVRHLRSVS